MNWYLYNNFGGSLRMTDVLDETYNAYADRPSQGYCMFRDEHCAKNLPIINAYSLETNLYVLIECSLDALNRYLDSIGKDWNSTHFRSGESRYVLFLNGYQKLHCASVSEEIYQFFYSRRKVLHEPQQLVFR